MCMCIYINTYVICTCVYIHIYMKACARVYVFECEQRVRTQRVIKKKNNNLHGAYLVLTTKNRDFIHLSIFLCVTCK